MSSFATMRRHSTAKINPNIRVGKQPSKIAGVGDINNLRQITILANGAMNVTDLNTYCYNLSEIDRLARKLLVSRL